ncbi:hypothetical protein KSP40_PGU022233 [Platanthera guangdongensis]|uniref:Uncharacterized protein n=1 Tax=Platanthera guangdongensis TaxID=2320717 RepID=A0ABR2MWJ8_9ASPA
MSPAIAPLWDDDEWEVCNDDGFIYKRRRRLAIPEGPSPADIEAELRRQKRARKWQCLQAIRDKYQREIDQWEGLSASLTHLASPPTSNSDAGPSSMDSAPPSPLSLPTVDDLLSTVNLVRVFVMFMDLRELTMQWRVAGWVLSAYFLGGYGDDGKGLNGYGSALAVVAMSWLVGLPDDDEWEVCNDDGFIYKRRRRLALPEGPSPADIEAELRRQKRARKWRCLRAIHDKYQREIDQWEGLSASLTRLASPPTSTSDAGPSSMDSAPPSPLSLPTVDDLLSTVNLVRVSVMFMDLRALTMQWRVAGWVLSAYFLGGYGDDGKGLNGYGSALAVVAMSWLVGLPVIVFYVLFYHHRKL